MTASTSESVERNLLGPGHYSKVLSRRHCCQATSLSIHSPRSGSMAGGLRTFTHSFNCISSRRKYAINVDALHHNGPAMATKFFNACELLFICSRSALGALAKRHQVFSKSLPGMRIVRLKRRTLHNIQFLLLSHILESFTSGTSGMMMPFPNGWVWPPRASSSDRS
ncbi:hypothetical protein P154DRAFT_304344 [Amniculicola lignicola CBS 123094]|uniref:Uncharacterized protein n=1 Tax=Amniculicola lignicola CBS 123094 TaxID=1392246 RepID=A0A6A5W7U5_9PLEO|nr:hypothetical protein P154DRAFT_304344 [Amniculicola lignicola CBS 123094]